MALCGSCERNISYLLALKAESMLFNILNRKLCWPQNSVRIVAGARYRSVVSMVSRATDHIPRSASNSGYSGIVNNPERKKGGLLIFFFNCQICIKPFFWFGGGIPLDTQLLGVGSG